MDHPGKAKGLTFEPMRKYIEHREGKKGVKKIEETMKKLGYSFSFEDVDEYKWYPEGLSTLIVYLSRAIFEWSDDDIYDMGYSDPSVSPILQVAIKFVSLESAFKRGPEVWKKHYNFGALIPEKLDKENKMLTVKILDYDQADFMHTYFQGYFARLAEIITGAEVVESKHESCTHPEAGICDAYTVKWR